MKKNKAFTLVELMVVIVIIGVLAALAIPRFLGASNKAKIAEFKPVMKQIYTLNEAYKQEKDLYGGIDKIGFDAPKGTNAARFTYSTDLDGAADAATYTATAELIAAIGGVAAGEQATMAVDATGTQTLAGAGTNAGANLIALANW